MRLVRIYVILDAKVYTLKSQLCNQGLTNISTKRPGSFILRFDINLLLGITINGFYGAITTLW